VLVKIRACRICGTDALFISMGGIPGHDGGMPSPCPSGGRCPQGHEPSGEVIEVGSKLTGIAVGDHVVINPMVAPSGIVGNGGASGGLSEYLLIANAVRGASLEVVPDHIPFEVAALNEPMAVAATVSTVPLPFGREVPPANPSRPTRWWSSAQARSGWARRSRSNRLGSATSWSPT
jgi:threonine dehydrogenase-like Zn-dependent dehydrogenase